MFSMPEAGIKSIHGLPGPVFRNVRRPIMANFQDKS
jgi:hypothetical protein